MIKKIRYGIKKLSDVVALLSVELLIVFLVFFSAFILLIIIIRTIFVIREERIDYQVFDFLAYYVSNANTSIMKFFTFFGSHIFLIPAYLLLIAYYFFIRKNKWHGIKLLTISLCNLALLFSLKFFFDRPRPLIPLLKKVPGLSFPSGHAFMSCTFFGLLIYIIYRDVKNKWTKWIS